MYTRLDKDNNHDWMLGCQDLRSSWHLHERVPPAPRPSRWIFYIDSLETGITLAQAETVEQAVACARQLGGIVRPYEITEENLQEDTAFLKWKEQNSL
jgi:hypothetical protein